MRALRGVSVRHGVAIMNNRNGVARTVLVLSCLLWLSACSGSSTSSPAGTAAAAGGSGSGSGSGSGGSSGASGSSGSTGSGGASSSSAPTVAQQLQALVASGDLPTLDVGSSIAGTDADSNGVRDDIDALIRAQSDTPVQLAALTQFAQSIQATLTLDVTNSSAVSTVAANVRSAVACLFTQYDATIAAQRAHWMQEISINTLPRLQAYDHFNAIMSGTVTPAATGAVCNA
jgi:hypothetical protein